MHMPGSARLERNGGEQDEHVVALSGDRFDPFTARRATRKFLHGRVDTSVCDEAVLLVSELVTNAVMHARTALTLRLRAEAGQLRVEVDDHDERLPVLSESNHESERGRGLHLLESVASRWGVTPRAGGKTVWFEVDLSSS